MRDWLVTHKYAVWRGRDSIIQSIKPKTQYNLLPRDLALRDESVNQSDEVLLIQPTVNVALRNKLLSTFFRPSHTWRQYADSFARRHWSGHQALGASCRTTADSGLPSSHRPEDLARSSHRMQKTKMKSIHLQTLNDFPQQWTCCVR